MISPASKQSAHPLQYQRIVVDHHDQVAIGCIHKRMSGGGRFADDVLLLVLRNPSSGIPNLDTQVDTPLAATDDHAANAGVAYRIRNQIENDALHQDEVAAYPGAAGNNP